MRLFLFSPTTSRVVTVIGIPWLESAVYGWDRQARLAWPLLSTFSRFLSASRPASILFRCSGVKPPAYLSMYFDPCSAMTSGIEVMATFWSIPATTCGATISLLSLSNWMVGPLRRRRMKLDSLRSHAGRSGPPSQLRISPRLPPSRPCIPAAPPLVSVPAFALPTTTLRAPGPGSSSAKSRCDLHPPPAD